MTILKMVVEVWANYNLSNVCVRLMESVNVKRDFFFGNVLLYIMGSSSGNFCTCSINA